jgi:hypothetical protein
MPEPTFVPASLETLGGGAAKEKFNHALEQALRNVHDPNCSATKVRTVTLVVKIVPSPDRKHLDLDINTKVKLADPDGFSIRAYTGKVAGQFVMVEDDIDQIPMFQKPEVTQITAVARKE